VSTDTAELTPTQLMSRVAVTVEAFGEARDVMIAAKTVEGAMGYTKARARMLDVRSNLPKPKIVET
jgi:hypothetical protein